MKIHVISKVRRTATIVGSTFGLVVLSLFGFGSTMTVLAGHASADSCTYIYNVGSEGDIAGSFGSGYPVRDNTDDGNCFHSIATGASAYGDWNVWQNGDGNCLWSDVSTLDLNSGCNSSNTEYQVLSPGVSGQPGYNLMSTVAMYEGTDDYYFWSVPDNDLLVQGHTYSSQGVNYLNFWWVFGDSE